MKKTKSISRYGIIFLFLGIFLLISLLVFLLKSYQGYSTYFFSATVSGFQNELQQLNPLITVLFYCGELVVGLIGLVPGIFFSCMSMWQGYCLLTDCFSYSEFLVSLVSLFLLMLYSVIISVQLRPENLLGYRLYQFLLNYVEQGLLFFAVTFLLMLHIIVLLKFKGIFVIEFLCKSIKPFCIRIKHCTIVIVHKGLLLCNYGYRIMIRFIDFIFQITIPSRIVCNNKKNFAQACQELIDFRVRYFNTLLLCESIDNKQSKTPLEKNTSPVTEINLNEPLFDAVATHVDLEHAAHIKNTARLLEEKLKRCGVLGTVVGIKEGPVVTLFEYKPEGDTKLTKILNLEDDLVMALEALSIRIRAPIPGTSLVGFEIANKKRQILKFGSLVTSDEYKNNTSMLPLVLGHDAQGFPSIYDLASMPHILMAGSTGSGKSVTLHGFIIGLLQSCTFQKLKLILIDPKRLELGYYQDIPHLLFPVVHEVARAVTVLQWVVEEMNRRYELIAQFRARSLNEYNNLVPEEDKLPFIVLVIDELADLMMTGGRDIEDKIVRLAQMARASGIHLIVATQRPSVDVVTGLIKVNFTSRIALRVTSRIDSRTIIDTPGAHKLLGKGDMLFLDGASGQLHRLHAALLTTAEIERVVSALKKVSPPHYLTFVDSSLIEGNFFVQEEDALLYAQVKKFLNEIDEVSISLLQRRFRIGYNRAARIIEVFQAEGIILPPDGSKVRKILR